MMSYTELILQNIKDAVILLDKDGYIVFTNPATTTVTGFPADELAGRHFTIFYPNESDWVKAEYELGLAIKKGQFITESWKVRKDGSRFWGEMTITPVDRDQGNPGGYCCILRDITEKKQEELEIRQSEQRFRVMVEGVRDYAIFMLDVNGNIISWNEGARRIKGYLSNEIIGRHFSTFYTREDLDDKKPERELKIAIATGKYEEEGWRVRKNGSVFWANVVITALFNEENKLIGFSKVTRDLTDRKENEEHLRQSEERFRSLVEQVTDYGIFMLDEKGRIISWNEGAKRMKGYQAEEIIGKYFSIFYTEEDIMNGKPAHELKVATREGKYEEEGWRLRKDGTPFWASVVITAIYNPAGALIGFSKVTRDLTERKEAERALRDSHDRYRMLANQLKITNDQLTYTNQELEQFTSIVSHDLQEPIRTIKSFLQLMDMKLDAKQFDDLKTYIGKSIGAANRMRELIQNLLHYSQLSKNEVVESTINVRELVNEAVQNLKTTIDACKASITIDTEVESIRGDRVQLLQLVQNLLGNAMKFTSEKTPEIRITCREENGQVRFSVADNGIGIAEADKQKVFDIFRRLHTKKDYPGTGIGLAICKKIVDRHGGRIWPESEPGKGTTFHITFNQQSKESPALT